MPLVTSFQVSTGTLQRIQRRRGLLKVCKKLKNGYMKTAMMNHSKTITGKLEDLKKLLQPIENIYKEGNAKYRSLADSLSAGPKEKDQINTLELFIRDTRSKLSSAYQSFATYAEREKITNLLIETEDWLNQKSEQDYSGRLNYLKKILEPIENRYKESTAIAKAVDDLQIRISKYRFLAVSLSTHSKKEIKRRCNEAERWLNNISQQLSTYNSSSYINKVIINFERNCRYMMEEPDDSNECDQPVDTKEMDEPVDWRKRNQHEKSNKRDQPVDSNKRDQHEKLNRREQPMMSNIREQPIKSNRRDQSVGSNKMDQSVISSQIEDQRDELVDSKKMDQPVGSNKTHLSEDLNKRDQQPFADSLPAGPKEENNKLKEGLNKRLQETKDSNDESEQDYAGKFEDLKKLLQPIENIYKEENAKALKALQNCIAKYRSCADSLPAGPKEEVKGLCNRAESMLNDITQKHSSSYINEAIEVFERGCRHMMEPKPSAPRHEQVIKKDQRNTLKLFINDTRSKLLSAYQSFASDAENEFITNLLLVTEDWLTKESEQDYTGKLEYLKKILEPIENRYKKENARAKSVKDLQTCIVKYRSHADSLPTRQKEEV